MIEMELFYYVNQNIARRILSSNLVACTGAYLNLEKSLGTPNDSHVFLTQRKLNKEVREAYFDPEASLFSVVVKLEIPDDYNPDVSFVEEKEGGYSIVSGKLSEYSSEYVGLFLEGCLPFSFVSGFLFASEEEKKRFWLPSQELWYPEEMYSLVLETEFTESIDAEKLYQLLFVSSEERDSILSSVNKIRKNLAMGYYAVRDTKQWINAKYEVNVDPYVLGLLGIDTNLAEEKIRAILAENQDTKGDPALILSPCKDDVLWAVEKKEEVSVKAVAEEPVNAEPVN